MPNPNKSKGRAAERDAQAYLEYLGWEVIDCHANDALEGRTNADLLAFPKGIEADLAMKLVTEGIGTLAEKLVEKGLEIQIKYSSCNSYGSRGVYNRHERRGIDLGKYRAAGPDADFGTYQKLWWRKHDDDGPYFSGGINAMRAELEGASQPICVDNKMGVQVRRFADVADILMCREPHQPWLVIWRGSLS